MSKQNFVLTEKQACLVEKLVDSGKYRTINDVIGDGLSLLERRETEVAAQLEVMQAHIQEAESISDQLQPRQPEDIVL